VNGLHVEVLKENIDALNLSAEWVKYSYDQCALVGIQPNYNRDEFDKFENLTSRYARATDMLVNKVLRSIDTVESEDIGTIIDIMNRAEKRGFVEFAELLHAIKDLRNNIVHEYQIKKITGFFADVLKYTPVLLEIIARVNTYCAKYY
jgi:hypothetical protein